MRFPSALIATALITLAGMAVGVAQAREFIATGSAAIRDGNQALARKLAFRDAASQAVLQSSTTVSAAIVSIGGRVTEDASLQSSAAIVRSDVLSEEISADRVQVTVRFDLKEPGDGATACAGKPLRKILVTGFALEHPEQVQRDEFSQYARSTPVEIRKALDAGKVVLSEHDQDAFIYVSPERAPVLSADGSDFDAVAAARKRRSQYVLSGVIRDFGVRASGRFFGGPQRAIVVDAYLHDGMNGALLASARFADEAEGEVRLPPNTVFGSRAFYETEVGAALGRIYGKIARWSESAVSCLPFSARVLQAEGKQIRIDAGAESRLQAGESFTIYRVVRHGKVVSLDDEYLGRERVPTTTLVLKNVYPLFAVGEQADAKPAAKLAPGDEVYGF